MEKINEMYAFVATEKDARRKLTDERKAEIKRLHESGWSIRAITRSSNVSRRTIQFILYPERLVKLKECRQKWIATYRANRRKTGQENKDVRKYRKRKVVINGDEYRQWRKEERAKYKNRKK